ncbi:uncharacterized protein [Hemitrygon akajei]|uniref:uncharacterized protein n=1 Tax=Hemitrygon akajei TaxID=2704970 RepID=UPI003BFA2808
MAAPTNDSKAPRSNGSPSQPKDASGSLQRAHRKDKVLFKRTEEEIVCLVQNHIESGRNCEECLLQCGDWWLESGNQWTSIQEDRQQLSELLDKALKLQISPDHSRIILDIQHYLSQGHHNRFPDETEASVHSLADDESVQSTHTVKSNAVLNPIAEEQAGSVFANPHLTFDKQEDPLQTANQSCSEHSRAANALVEMDTSQTLRPTNLFTFNLLKEEYIKMYTMVIELKDSLINFFLGKKMIPAAQAFQEIAAVRYCPDVDILAQVLLMASSSQCILNEVLTVFSALLNTDGMNYPESFSGWSFRGKAAVSIGSALHDNRGLKSLQDSGKNANVPISVNCVKSPFQTEFPNKFQPLQQQYDDVIQGNNKGQRQNKQQIDKRKNHISCLQRELNTVHHLNISQCTRGYVKFEKKQDPDAILLFTRTDVNHNTRVLTKGVNNNIISKENYKNAVRTMEKYIDLQKERFFQLVKQYSQHVTLKEAEKCITHQVGTSKPISEAFKKMKELYLKRKSGWNEEALKFTKQRITLANALMNTLENIEEESGLFLIKPTQSWKGRPASKKIKAKVSIHQRMPIKTDQLLHVPVPSFRASKQMGTSSDTSFSTPQIVSLTRTYNEKLQELSSRYDKNPASIENYIKGLWKKQIDSPDSATLNRTILFTTPRLLEMEFKRNGIVQRNVSCRLPQLTLQNNGKKELAYNKLQNIFIEKNSSPLHVVLQRAVQENKGMLEAVND